MLARYPVMPEDGPMWYADKETWDRMRAGYPGSLFSSAANGLAQDKQ
jgi:hypothetical protein